MDKYIDIVLLPDAEFPTSILMNAIYSKLHKKLFEMKSHNIGVSFPRYKLTLGNLLRVHGDMSNLQNLQAGEWLGAMHTYCMTSQVKNIPANGVSFRTISRVQSTMSNAKLKRLQKRGSISTDEVKQYKAKMFSQGLDNPYLELVSTSNGHKHRRYLVFGEITDNPVSGEFDFFGLSKTATIPWFE
ncbi:MULTISPECIES: type I-F CRISPR-associated endoribonuclease Cas6/Csy4 [Cysteiniphilum]|uniref:type I-F CRISPR-associated endoribonuclease Cas6/Csy4 n=1 Tax=Cysteiniphilum TaxID=2056696 RepID=UPI00177EA0A4|nr:MULTISPECIES: type I-F CRISPR-associated endoribonuclease Cas6/Csy4 [Cysteiniphilum]